MQKCFVVFLKDLEFYYQLIKVFEEMLIFF